MHANAEAAVSRRLKTLLDSFKVKADGRGLKLPNLEGEYAEFQDEALKHCREWLRPTDILMLVLSPAYDLVYELTRTGASVPKTRTFKDYVGEHRMNEMFIAIMDELKALPMTYTGFLLLPLMNCEGIHTCNLAPGVRLINGSELKDDSAFWPTPSKQSLSALADAVAAVAERDKHFANAAFLACTAVGYYKTDSTATGATALLSIFKQVLSLARMKGLVERPIGASLMIKARSPSTHLIVRNESKARYESELELPNLLRDHAAESSFTESIFEPRTGLLGGTQPVDKCARLQEVFKTAALCFRDAEQHADILTAAEWAFDASSEDNETLSYLYSAIGLEAILGAPVKEITSTLGDRLAYLIGRSRTERKDIQENFKSFYEHRSKIVHGKRARLRPEEVELLQWARACIDQAIVRELSLVRES